MRTSWILVAAFVALSPAWVVAQESGDPEQRIAVAMQTAASAGIPVALLEEKVAEGKAKGLPMDVVAQAVEHRLNGLAQARAALTRRGNAVSSEELSAGANAIGVGVSGVALETIDAKMPPGDRWVAINVLTELYSVHGIPVDEALAHVLAAGEQGASAVANLPAQARAGQLPPAASIRGRPDGVGRPPAAAGMGARPPVARPGGRP